MDLTTIGILKKEMKESGEGGFSGSWNDIKDKPEIPTVPTTLPNPHALTFTGAVTGSYDGSEPVEVNIPENSGGNTEYEWVLINEINVEFPDGGSGDIIISEDLDGNPLNETELYIEITNRERLVGYITVSINGKYIGEARGVSTNADNGFVVYEYLTITRAGNRMLVKTASTLQAYNKMEETLFAPFHNNYQNNFEKNEKIKEIKMGLVKVLKGKIYSKRKIKEVGV